VPALTRFLRLVLTAVYLFTVANGFAQNQTYDSKHLPGDTTIIERYKPDLAARYPYGVVFMPAEKVDSVLEYADTELVPIIFKCNKTDIRFPNTALDSVVDVVNRILDDPYVTLSHVWIGGSASPEGPEAHNLWLGKTRAGRLNDYLKSHTALPDSLVRIENLGEDWHTPLRLIERSNFANKERVLKIWDEQHDNIKRKRQIMAIDGGKTWRYLINEVFGPARNARMVIVCVAEDSVVTYRRYHPTLHIPTPSPTLTTTSRSPLSIATEYRGQFIAIKTNLAALGLLVANIGGEFSFGRGFSLDLPFYYSPYDITSKFRVRILGTQPELRYWLRRDWPGEGHFFGINGTVAGFNVSFPITNRFQDPERALWGVGLSYGYAMNFGRERHWGLEFNIGAGYMNYHLDTFENVSNGKLIRTEKKHFWGITRFGVSLTYKFWRRKAVATKINAVGGGL